LIKKISHKNKHVTSTVDLPLSLFVCILTLTFVGCGSSENSPSPTSGKVSPELNACTMVSLSEIEGVMGEKVQVVEGFPKTMSLQGGQIVNSRCNYHGLSTEKALGLNVTFAPENKDKYPKTLEAYLEISLKEMGAPDEEVLKKSIAVEGIGNFSVWNQELGGLLVYAGEYKILTTIGHFSKGTEASDFDRAKVLAQKVLQML